MIRSMLGKPRWVLFTRLVFGDPLIGALISENLKYTLIIKNTIHNCAIV